MCAKQEFDVSKPVGDRHVVPTTRFRDNRGSCAARPRIGDLDGLARNGELDGVSFSRLLVGVATAAILSPLISWAALIECGC